MWSSSADCTIKEWDTNDKALCRTFVGHEVHIPSLLLRRAVAHTRRTTRCSTAPYGIARQCTAWHRTHRTARQHEQDTAPHLMAPLRAALRHKALQCRARHRTALTRYHMASHLTALHRTAQHCTAPQWALHGTAPHSTAVHHSPRCCAAWYGTAMHCTARHRTARHRTPLQSSAVHFTNSTQQHGTAPNVLHRTLVCRWECELCSPIRQQAATRGKARNTHPCIPCNPGLQ